MDNPSIWRSLSANLVLSTRIRPAAFVHNGIAFPIIASSWRLTQAESFKSSASHNLISHWLQMAPARSKPASPNTPSPRASPAKSQPRKTPSPKASSPPAPTPFKEKYAKRDDWRDFYRWERSHVSTSGRIQKLHERWKLMPNKKEFVKYIRLLEEWQGYVGNWTRRIVEAEAKDADLKRRYYIENQKLLALERLEWRLNKFIEVYSAPIPQIGKLKPEYAFRMLQDTKDEIAAIYQARAEGRFRCHGHGDEWRDPDGKVKDAERTADFDALENEWNEYFGILASTDDVVPEPWVFFAAIDRALMLFDHSNVTVHPPEITDVGNQDENITRLVQCLNELYKEEERAYKELPIYWNSLDELVQASVASKKLYTGDYDVQKAFAAVKSLRMKNLDEEAPNSLEPSLRALRHSWDDRLRRLFSEDSSPAQMAELVFFQHLALRAFDSDERKWVLHEADFDR